MMAQEVHTAQVHTGREVHTAQEVRTGTVMGITVVYNNVSPPTGVCLLPTRLRQQQPLLVTMAQVVRTALVPTAHVGPAARLLIALVALDLAQLIPLLLHQHKVSSVLFLSR